jgi:hypothetical protein
MRDKIVSFRATSAPLRSSPGWGSYTSCHFFWVTTDALAPTHRVPVCLGDLHDGRERRTTFVALGILVEDIAQRARKNTLDLLHLSNQTRAVNVHVHAPQRDPAHPPCPPYSPRL